MGALPSIGFEHRGEDDWCRDPERMSSMSIQQRVERPATPRPAGWTMHGVGRQTLFVLSVFPLSLLALVLVTTTFGVGLGLAFTVIGLPVLALCAHTARMFALFLRQMIRRMLDLETPAPVYLRSDGGFLRRSLTTLGDPQSWLDIVFGFFGWILTTIAFSLTVTWWSVAVGGLSWVLWGWALPRGGDNQGLPELIGLGPSYWVALGFWFVAGLLFAATLPWVVRASAWMVTGPAMLLLSGRAQLQQEVEYQVKGREAARTAEAGSLRRLERDIHDGPQQRLVRLTMDLGRAKKQINDDPGRARDTIDEAITQTRQTLDELRALSRGIAPPVLSDRGLRAALQEIVARSSVPVHLRMDVQEDLPDHVETAAYFVVSEALVNVAKHSMASYAVIELSYQRPVLTVEVSDDGVGGAQLAKGHGLVGLADRVRSVDGVLNVTSPPGGPTRVTAEISCAS